jgi:hypothetical protein
MAVLPQWRMLQQPVQCMVAFSSYNSQLRHLFPVFAVLVAGSNTVCLPLCPLQVVTAWNGQGISAFALAARILPAEQPPAGPCFPVDGCSPSTYMQASQLVIIFMGQLIVAIGSTQLAGLFAEAARAGASLQCVHVSEWHYQLKQIEIV